MKSASDNEVFSYFGMNFDVDLAERLIQQSPHESRVAPRAFLESFVSVDEDEPDENGVTHIDITKHHINKDHLQNVDITKPGIVAQITFKAEKGRPEQHASTLIDGNHRAVRAIKEDKEFRVYILTPEESWEVMAEATYPALLKHYVNPTKKKPTTKLKLKREAAGIKYYHGSSTPLRQGTVLTPGKGVGLQNHPILQAHEMEVDKLRPRDCISRQRCIYMCASPEDVKRSGGSGAYIYEVAPIGQVDKSDQAWYGVSDDLSNPDSFDAIANYWEGVPYPNSNESLWEYRAKSAKVVGLVKAGGFRYRGRKEPPGVPITRKGAQ